MENISSCTKFSGIAVFAGLYISLFVSLSQAEVMNSDSDLEKNSQIATKGAIFILLNGSQDVNRPPTAKAGIDKIVLAGTTVLLDGSESSDPENSPLHYNWTFILRPAGSSAVLANASSSGPSFIPDVVGDYLLGVSVSDSNGGSASDSVMIRAVDGAVTASRTSGVAPLYVFFDSGFTSSTEVSRPFHDLTYKWNFDDPSSNAWAITESTTGLSKNKDSGPVAAHVFENPGTYDVSLNVYDASGGFVKSDTVQIAVSDPDAVYGPSNTICIGDSTSNSTGCPGIGSGATYIATDNILEMRNHVQSGRRVLLQRGSTWSASETVLSFDKVNGPITIGAYGSCTAPDARGICQNAPVINMASAANFLSIYNLSDWRIMDLKLIGALENNSVVSSVSGLESVLLFRISSDGFDTAIGIGYYNTNGHDQVAIVDCDIVNAYDFGIYGGSERLSIMGTRIRDTADGHNIRIWQAHYGVISHNLLSGAHKLVLKLHGPPEDRVSKTDDTLLDNRTENLVVSDNVFGTSYAWAVPIAAANSAYDTRLTEILVEKNRFLSGVGTAHPNPVQQHLQIGASNITVRNNIFDGSGSIEYRAPIAVDKSGPATKPAITGVNIYNNTCYHDTASPLPQYYGIYVYEAEGVEIKNNLITLPLGAANAVYYCSDCDQVSAEGNLLTNSPEFVDSANADYLQRNFDLQAGSPAINYGVTVPVIEDFNGDERPDSVNNLWDAGAFEY